MFFEFSLKSSFLLVFFFHGIVFATLLLIKGLQTRDNSNQWLSLFTFLCVLYIAPFMLGYAGWYSRQPYRDILFYLPFQQLLLLPPVLFFYCRTLFDKSFVFTKRNLLHFFPAIVYLIYSLVIFLVDKFIVGEYYFYNDERDKDFAFWYQATGFISLVYYLILSLNSYRKYKLITYNTYSYADALTYKWAQRFLIAFLTLLALRTLFFVINPEWANFGKKFWYYICFSILFYYISISGYINSLRSITSFSNTGDYSQERKEIAARMESVSQNSDVKETIEKTEIAGLNSWKQRVEDLILQHKLYENPELSVSDISDKLDTHPKKVSQIINQGFNMNFNDYINRHRVNAVIQKFQTGEHKVQTLLGIALECGFNSKSTFNRVFKRHTSVSPVEYIQKNSL